MNAPESLDSIKQSDVLQPLRKQRRHHRTGPRWLRKVGKNVKRFNWRLFLLVFCGIMAVLAVSGIALATDAASRVESSLNNLSRVISSLSRKPGTELTLADFERIDASIDDVKQTLAAANRQTQFLRPFTSLSPSLEIQLESLDITRQLTSVADQMLAGLEPTIFFMVGTNVNEVVLTQISSGERVVELLRIGRGQFVEAGAQLALAKQHLEALNLADVPPGLLLDVQTLVKAQEQLQEINTLLLVAPELLTSALGLNTEQSYLILAQNSDELRPSGGYISTYGWMQIRNGRIIDYDYSATTATSPNPPPDSVDNPYPVPQWWLQYERPVYAAWDGSWYTDFPSTAEMSMWFYNEGNNPSSPVSGVIAIDIVGFEYILGALRQVAVPGYDVVVTPENFRQVIYEIRASGEGDLPHKQFLIALYRQLFEDWKSVEDQETSSELLGATLRGLQEKHIMLYFADEQLNQAVDLLGWSGSQSDAIGHDYLMVADANLGNKSNHSIIRQLVYDTSIQLDGSLNSRITIDYEYPASIAEQDPAVDPQYHGPLDYNNLLQVFFPVNSRVTETSELLSSGEVIDDSAFTVMTTEFTVPYDSGQRLQFAYSTPPIVEPYGPYQRYRLLVQKQPGTLHDPVSIQVSLPTNATLISTSPEPAASYQLEQRILEFRADLVSDQWIEIVYQNQAS
jgi:hypothetical protein